MRNTWLSHTINLAIPCQPGGVGRQICLSSPSQIVAISPPHLSFPLLACYSFPSPYLLTDTSLAPAHLIFFLAVLLAFSRSRTADGIDPLFFFFPFSFLLACSDSNKSPHVSGSSLVFLLSLFPYRCFILLVNLFALWLSFGLLVSCFFSSLWCHFLLLLPPTTLHIHPRRLSSSTQSQRPTCTGSPTRRRPCKITIQTAAPPRSGRCWRCWLRV